LPRSSAKFISLNAVDLRALRGSKGPSVAEELTRSDMATG
jgi:hypothetical protein